MSDELYEIRNKVILCIIVGLIIVTVGLIFVFNRFGDKTSEIVSAINNKESLIIYFSSDSNSCDKCDMVKTILDEYDISYYEENINTTDSKTILEKLNISFDVVAPSVVVIEKGVMTYNIIDIEDQTTIISFIDSNKLTSFKK